MSDDDQEYLDDPEIVDFNEELDARAARSMEEDEIPTSPLMFGTIGRGSPEMDLKTPRVLYRDAAKALRREGMNDDSHLKDPTNLEPFNEQQKAEAKEKKFDEMIDRVYKEIKKPVKSAARPMSKAKIPLKKGGTRKRSTRRRVSRRNKRSSRRRSKRSRKNKRR